LAISKNIILYRKFFQKITSKHLRNRFFCHLEEAQLIISLKANQASAFKYLVEHYQGRVYNTVLSIVQQPNEAEDLTQEVFIEVYQSIGGFRGDAKLSTWLYRIATSKALEAYRKSKTQKRFSFLTSLWNSNNEIQHHPPEFEHPGVILENKERSKILFNAIAKLPNNQKIAFTLCHVEGLSYQEIAEVMQNTVSSVESLLFRAKGNLKNYLKNYYEKIL
jgi:RNA polymerase sigma factor (sigma-70 family)